MPIIDVNVWEGFGQERAKMAIQGITSVFEDVGIPKHAVEVVVHEIPKTHWGIDGEPASDRFPEESPPEQRCTSCAEHACADESLGKGHTIVWAPLGVVMGLLPLGSCLTRDLLGFASRQRRPPAGD